LILIACGWCAFAVAAEPNAHNLRVSLLRPYATATFSVVERAAIAVLNTRPDEALFQPRTGRVAESRRHDGVPWRETYDGPRRHTAKSPPLPAGASSHVICVGRFAAAVAGPGPAAPLPLWRSELNEPGVHVIVSNRYASRADIRPGADGVSQNLAYDLSAQALADSYLRSAEAARDRLRVVRVSCGFRADIDEIGELPGHLRRAPQSVENESVVAYDTLGHGARIPVEAGGPDEIRAMRCARSGRREDYVGRVADIGAVEFQPPRPYPMAAADYAALVRGFLTDEAVVNLFHCFTGEPYTSPVDGSPVGSIASQVKRALPQGVTVVGVRGDCALSFEFDDLNGNGRWDPPGETVVGINPYPRAGGDWEFNDGR
jgi:hypothetical protein